MPQINSRRRRPSDAFFFLPFGFSRYLAWLRKMFSSIMHEVISWKFWLTGLDSRLKGSVNVATGCISIWGQERCQAATARVPKYLEHDQAKQSKQGPKTFWLLASILFNMFQFCLIFQHFPTILKMMMIPKQVMSKNTWIAPIAPYLDLSWTCPRRRGQHLAKSLLWFLLKCTDRGGSLCVSSDFYGLSGCLKAAWIM